VLPIATGLSCPWLVVSGQQLCFVFGALYFELLVIKWGLGAESNLNYTSKYKVQTASDLQLTDLPVWK